MNISFDIIEDPMNEKLQRKIRWVMERMYWCHYNVHSDPNPIGLWPAEQLTIAYYSLLSNPNNNWLEIGSFAGGSACLQGLCRELLTLDNPNEYKNFCIDKSDEFANLFWKNLKKIDVDRFIKRITSDSYKFNEFWNNENGLSFAFIDGWHSYKYAIMEFDFIYPYLEKNSYILFHDSDGLSKENFESISKNQEENHDEWMKELIPVVDPHPERQTYNITQSCVYITKKYQDVKCVQVPSDLRATKNSITVLRKV